MRSPPRILIADDSPASLDILRTRLVSQGYEVVTATDGQEAVDAALEHRPDLILLDVMMPRRDGFEVCRLLRADPALPYIPIILVTAKDDTRDIVAGLDSGADEYLTKPVDHAALTARVRSMLRAKALHDTVHEQAALLAEWNHRLEQRVADQVAELERMGRLKRFLSPQVAELVISSGAEHLLDSHRRDVAVVFCDLRGFTAFGEAAEPEDVMRVVGEYHVALGALIHQFEGTLERFAGDGLLVLFNDPMPCPDSALRAVRMAVAMRDRIEELAGRWRAQGYELGFGIGIAQGLATLGTIGFEGRRDYAAIGTVVNLAARLCDMAKPGQILISERVFGAVRDQIEAEACGGWQVKGLARPEVVHDVRRLRAEPAPARVR
jgi:adenylate cyclase